MTGLYYSLCGYQGCVLFSLFFKQSATGVYLAALPTPGGIQIAGKTPNDGTYEQHISHMQKKINDTIAKNKELYEINPPVSKCFILKNKTF